jgi:ankyrin repeat protein
MAINNRSEHGATLLMHAVYGGNGRTVQMLLDAGADPKLEAKSASGRVIHTAASLARVNNDDELVATIEAHAAHSAVDRILSAVIRRQKP